MKFSFHKKSFIVIKTENSGLARHMPVYCSAFRVFVHVGKG